MAKTGACIKKTWVIYSRLKNLCHDETKKTKKKIQLQKSKLEFQIQEFRSLAELMFTDYDNNETDLEREYEEFEIISSNTNRNNQQNIISQWTTGKVKKITKITTSKRRETADSTIWKLRKTTLGQKWTREKPVWQRPGT